jgi:hypothetical protein
MAQGGPEFLYDSGTGKLESLVGGTALERRVRDMLCA